MLPIDMRCKRFGRLTVVDEAPSIGGKAAWRCHCDCGNEATITGSVLRLGKSNSCGCLRRELGRNLGVASRRHGEASNSKETPEYRTWAAMLSRCNNPNHCNYPYYGARGISVCERWQTYENFLADMGRRPSKYHSIDRIDNDGNYCPENCRWATSEEQNNNQRKPKERPGAWRILTVNGIEKPLREWLVLVNLPQRTYFRHVAAGLTPEQVISQRLAQQ
jgi:hypothetical protein